MRYQAAVVLALILFWGYPHLTYGGPAGKAARSNEEAKTRVEVRHFSFPADYPLGSLHMMGNEKDGTEADDRSIGPAKGAVSLTVPPGQTILLDLNPRCLELPERLKNIHTAGINRLKMRYLSMDDNDHSHCDRALQALPEFKDLISLDVARSDATDKGLSGFKSLPSVKHLLAYGADLDGSIFKETQKLRNLESLFLSLSPIKSENFKYLSALPHLTELQLSHLNLEDKDLIFLSQCRQIKQLYMFGNPKITDKSLPVFKQLTPLEELDIRGCGISLPGVLTLKNLKLTKLLLPVKRYRPNEIEELQKAFPKTLVCYRGEGVAKDDQIFFAPLK
ncbi:MAG: hypothetical protein P4L53_11525 [Candidatus Obscuribacterales bacterium]|nr:hypothetical protein [Candidatus Obscuribacterales bacterium]